MKNSYIVERNIQMLIYLWYRKVLITKGNNLFDKYEKMKHVTLGQFLYLIKNAAYIFTSSFHAVVILTVFQKDFFAMMYQMFRGEKI